jgi:hypothetical protein
MSRSNVLSKHRRVRGGGTIELILAMGAVAALLLLPPMILALLILLPLVMLVAAAWVWALAVVYVRGAYVLARWRQAGSRVTRISLAEVHRKVAHV